MLPITSATHPGYSQESARLLAELAARHGLSASYRAQSGGLVVVPASTLVYFLRAAGVDISDTPDVDELSRLLYEAYLNSMARPLPPAVVAPQGEERSFLVHVHAGDPAHVYVELESGGTREVYQDTHDVAEAEGWGEAKFHLPGDLPLGYHQLHLGSPGTGQVTCPLIITPARLNTADEYLSAPAAGVMAQLYSVRSRSSWGIGDFGDLAALARTIAPDADFLLINPLHAAEPQPPVEDSPYLPTTRRYINPIYLNIEAIPELELLDDAARADVAEIAAEFALRNASSAEINRDEIFAAKLEVLKVLHAQEFTPQRQAQFRAFTQEQGKALYDFAAWCGDVDFYSWLQFLCFEQLAAAQAAAKEAGMRIGLMTDLAVGVHPGGADAVNLAEYLEPAASVGAPPDEYNQLGQDWSQPPWHPTRLAEAAYAPWRDMLRGILSTSGGIRVDHVLGLFRLFWIPRMQPASMGTYMAYDWEAMVGILLLEAQRAGAVVVGEDLGTMEDWVQRVLSEKGVLGTSIIWFEKRDGQPLPAADYRPLSLSSVGTHDLPPTAAYLRGDHVRLRAQLGLLTRSVDAEFAQDKAWQEQVLAVTGPDVADLHRFIASTPAALTCTNLVDLVGDVRAQNMPGTTHALYPNWCIPLCDENGDAVLIEDLTGLPLYRAVMDASRRPSR